METNLKTAGKNVSLNIIASLFFRLTEHAFVYPQVCKVLGVEAYGLFLTIMGIIAIIGGTFGNSLNNVRLILNEEYQRLKVVGDYNVLLAYSVIAGFTTLCVGIIYFRIDTMMAIMIVLTASLMIVREYLSVAYRLKLNYMQVLSMNAIISSVYMIVTILYVFFGSGSNNWIFIFFIGEVTAVGYLLKTTELLEEPFIKTILFSPTTKKYLHLIYMSFIGGVLLYFDRNILLYLLNGEAVTIYFVATVLAKAIGMLAGPTAGVLLSYLGQADFVMTRRLFWKLNLSICAAFAVFYVVTMMSIDMVIQLFYPSVYLLSKPFFGIATFAVFCSKIGELANPTVLKYVASKKVSLFNTFFLLFTIITSYYAIYTNGIWGFCYSSLVLSMIKVASLWMLGDMALRDK